MSPELNKKLLDKYPEIFSGPMPFGFECGDGWFDLIDVLCQRLNKLEPIPIAIQGKEKFGGLRFYVVRGSFKAFALIDFAEQLSYRICEQCGCPGEIRGKGWVKTLCNKCANN